MTLEATAGPCAGKLIAVDDAVVVGRQAPGPGLLPDPEISREHARLERRADGSFTVEDLGSSNGTSVNGLRLDAPSVLAVGDAIELGSTILTVRSLPAPGTAAAPMPGTASNPVAQRPGAQPPGAPLGLRVEVDFDARVATVVLGEGEDAMAFTLEDGHWRLRTAPA
jgi:pSer/pThr/pTyr-binding forkhead associated (FHA) protein